MKPAAPATSSGLRRTRDDVPAAAPAVLRWVPSIADIAPADWERCFGTALSKSHAFHLAVEEAALPGIAFRYLVAEDAGGVRGIVPCFTYLVGLDILADGPIALLLGRVKRRFPRLLQARIFFAGSPVALCDHLWGLPAGPADADLGRRAVAAIRSASRREGCLVTILKEIPSAQRGRFCDLLGRDFFLAESLPNSYLVTSPDLPPWLEGFRKKYRNRIKSGRRKFAEAGYTWEICDRFGEYAERFESLYLQVLGKSRTKFERLNAAFFRRVSERLAGTAFAILGRDAAGNLVCFEIVLEEDSAIVPMYLGLDYGRIDAGDVYFNCIYRIAEEAGRRGKRLVKLGQTSYEAKAYAGAVFERLYLAVDSPRPPVRFLLHAFARALFPRIPLPASRCFRDEVARGVEAELAGWGIDHEEIKTTETEP